jgi:hypothetical protein
VIVEQHDKLTRHPPRDYAWTLDCRHSTPKT